MKLVNQSRSSYFGAALALFSLFLVLISACTLMAQLTTARLSGVVTDNGGSALPGADVTVREVETGFSQTVKSGEAGEYLFPSLPVGNYELTVDMTGFSSYVQKGIVLAVGQAASRNIELKVGAFTDQVTVTADASLVTTDSATVGQLINQQSVSALPLNGRDVQQLVFLIPGATNVTSQNCAANCEGGTFQSEQYAKVNGGGANGVSYLLDGVDFNDPYINANLPFPNPDAIQEFNVDTNNMSAAYGNATGGIVNVVTKSGTDQIHGSAFEYLRNYALDASNYFATSPDPLKQNQFGGSIGGPILKNRLFYFGSYQGTRTNTASNGQVQFVPTAAERQGDFSDLLPTTQLVDPVTGTPFLNNQVPTSRFSPVANYLLQHIPLPNGPGRQLTYNGAPLVQNTDEYLAKVDYNIGKHHLSGHYFQMNFNVPIFVPPATNILEINNNPAQSLTLKNISVVDLYSVSSTFFLNSYFGYTNQAGGSRSNIPFNMADAGVNIAQPPSPSVGVGPGIDFRIAGGIYIHGLHYGDFTRGDQSLRETATLIRGKHAIQFGGEVLRISTPMANEFEEDGNFGFSNSLSGDNTADFMLGAVSNFAQGGGLYLNVTGMNWSAFVQDDWRATPRLTVSAGLRWDPFFPYTDSRGRVACFEPGSQSTRFPNAPQGLLFGGDNHDAGCPKSSIENNVGNLGPRIGFAYQLTQDAKTSLRGGAGYFYESPNTVAFEDAVGIPPFAPIVSLSDVNLSNPYGSAGVTNPFPAGFGPTNPGPNASFPQDISLNPYFSQHFRLPVVLTYNLTLERGIGQSWLARAAYMGSLGSHLNGTGDQEAGLLATNAAVYIPGQSTEANTQQRRPYPNFGPLYELDSEVNSNYNALQLTLQKRLTQGFSFLSNFTWSKSLDDFGPQGSSGSQNPTGSNTCTCGRSFDYGPDNGDISKTFKISGNYQLPTAHLNGPAGSLINGWELTAIATEQTGFPYSIYANDDNSFSGIGNDLADLAVPNIKGAVLSSGRSHTQLVQQWFNTNAFTANAIGTFGNSGKDVLRGPRYFDADIALLKNTKIREGVSAQFRAEFYNALNNVNFGMPDTGLTDSAFGQLTYAMSPRILQFSLKALF
ncbi:TonB-dependent receptor [Acidicapsa acidisoli]|uniref:TonB-dependent receptor n=1 Tax=Acidicapsa acidisoli TaxID=1615681 RepID=UPI0021E0C679|nr:TonB-dependent receptor [Acidicapsa acidisoli]